MAIADDLADSWQHVEGVETVTFTPQNPQAASIENVKAKRRVLSRANLSQFGGVIGLSPDDVPFHLWVSTLGGVTPKQGDLVTDGDQVTYTIQAAISAVHATAPNPEATDWREIVALYDVLMAANPSPVVALNRAVAIAMRDGPEAGVALIDAEARRHRGAEGMERRWAELFERHAGDTAPPRPATKGSRMSLKT